ncbi:MAG: LD-carboxypeptidase [Phycisphaerae bacterium]
MNSNTRPGAKDTTPARIHLLAHANPIQKDIDRFEFASASDYASFICGHLPTGSRLTYSPKIFAAREDVQHGGRIDDAARIRDLQGAIDDPHTAAIIALAGGAWLGRVLPHIDPSSLQQRKHPLIISGFSEITGLLNWLATYKCVRAYYWLCPNYLAWKIAPPAAARTALGEFWKDLPRHFDSTNPDATIRGTLVRGTLKPGRTRIVGGCLSVLVATLAGPIARRVQPTGAWLALEDIGEAVYRIDRYLATLKLAGWFDRIAGILLGDFHTKDEPDQTAAILELLKYHLPRERKLPIVVTRDVGHVWPIRPLLINRPLRLLLKGKSVSFTAEA